MNTKRERDAWSYSERARLAGGKAGEDKMRKNGAELKKD